MREKLIELLESAESAFYWDSGDKGFIEKIADHLIANGVTATMPADHKPPLLETVLAYGGYYREYPPRWLEACWTGDWWVERGGLRLMVTRWMPLPEPPKGE